jgi:hypothetical protein
MSYYTANGEYHFKEFMATVAHKPNENVTYMNEIVNENVTYMNEIVKDLNNNCGDWASKGECSKNPDYMLPNCPVSCKDKDKDKDCQYWASKGECSKNPDYMLQNCPVSCETIKPNCTKDCERKIIDSAHLVIGSNPELKSKYETIFETYITTIVNWEPYLAKIMNITDINNLFSKSYKFNFDCTIIDYTDYSNKFDNSKIHINFYLRINYLDNNFEDYRIKPLSFIYNKINRFQYYTYKSTKTPDLLPINKYIYNGSIISNVSLICKFIVKPDSYNLIKNNGINFKILNYFDYANFNANFNNNYIPPI